MARMIIDQEQLQVISTTVDAQVFGGSINNPMAVNIHGQPLQYRDFSNYILMNSHATMDIDSWIYGMRRRSDLAKSYSGGGQPPSIGDIRQMVVSEVSGGSNQMSSDGQPPSVNDVGRREPSQSESPCNGHEGPDEQEVQQVISELNDGVYNRGAVGRSIEITTYSGYDGHTQDLISRFGLNFSQSFGVPHMNFNTIDSTENYGGVWAPPPKPFQRMRTYTKVHKRGSLGRSIEITTYSSYYELRQYVARIFGIEGQLDDTQRIGWKLVYVDHEKDILLVGSDPWEEFVNCVQSIKILSPQEVHQMRLDGSDYGGNSVVQNQARISSVMEQFNGRLLNLF